MTTDDEASGGSPRLQGTGTREGNSIRLVKGSAGEPEAGGAGVRASPRRPEREGLMRAEVGVLALREGLRVKDLDERRESYLLARSELRRSISQIEADLDRLPSSEWGPWRVEEEKLKRLFERREREKRLGSRRVKIHSSGSPENALNQIPTG